MSTTSTHIEIEIGDILEDLRELQAEMATMNTLTTLDPVKLVQLGALLWNISDTTSKMMEPIKLGLRTQAEQISKGQPGPVEFRGGGGKCVVVIQNTKVKLRKGAKAQMDQAQNVIPNFSDYFDDEVVYTPTRDFMTKADKAPPEVMVALNELVDILTDQPRVTFKPKRGSR